MQPLTLLLGCGGVNVGAGGVRAARHPPVKESSDMHTVPPAGASADVFDRVADAAGRLERELGRAIVGQSRVVREILIAFVAGGHCLLRGVPGLAKTLLIKTLAECVDLKFNRIQFTPDLMP